MAIVSISRNDIDTILSTAGTRLVSVVFTKKSGEKREMVGHLKVKSKLAGGYSTISHIPELVSIYDMKNGYRCFSKNRLIQMKVNGNLYKIKD